MGIGAIEDRELWSLWVEGIEPDGLLGSLDMQCGCIEREESVKWGRWLVACRLVAAIA